jgi:hypothetical protein
MGSVAGIDPARAAQRGVRKFVARFDINLSTPQRISRGPCGVATGAGVALGRPTYLDPNGYLHFLH